MRIRDFEIGVDGVFVIAEFCTNIFGGPSIRAALIRFCHSAKNAGSDAVKVQLYRHDHFPQTEWDDKRQTEFPRELFPEFCTMAHELGMAAGASVFDDEATRLCARHGDFIKLATREKNNADLHCSASGLPIIRSVDWRNPGSSRLDGVVLGCVPLYPTPPRRDYLPYKLTFSLPCRSRTLCGWSSHTQGYADVLCAVKQGAAVIEKHFCTHSSDLEARWSLMPRDFAEMVWNIRILEVEKWTD